MYLFIYLGRQQTDITQFSIGLRTTMGLTDQVTMHYNTDIASEWGRVLERRFESSAFRMLYASSRTIIDISRGGAVHQASRKYTY